MSLSVYPTRETGGSGVLGDVTGTYDATTKKVSLDVQIQNNASAPVPVTGELSLTQEQVATESRAVISSSLTNQEALAAKSSRKGFILFNRSTQSCFIRYGSTAATTTAFTYELKPGGSYNSLNDTVQWMGAIQSIWGTVNGDLQVTEFTA